MKDYICLDLEMTGLDPKNERIIEIGAVKIVNGLVVDSFQAFANPNRKLSAEISTITGIKDDMLMDARSDWEIVQEFLAFSKDCPLVGHHMITDIAFLKQCAANHKQTLILWGVDTLYLARKFLPAEISKTLTSVAEYLDISYSHGHRAMEDAQMTYQIFAFFENKFGEAYPECFRPKEVVYKAKKQGPITAAQVRQLEALLHYHNLSQRFETSHLTKNEASRMIDKIILQYGRIRSDDV